MNIEEIENGIKITLDKKENHTLEESEQQLINELYKDVKDYMIDSSKVELLNILIKKEKFDLVN